MKTGGGKNGRKVLSRGSGNGKAKAENSSLPNTGKPEPLSKVHSIKHHKNNHDPATGGNNDFLKSNRAMLTALSTYNSRELPMNARTGIDPELFFDAVRNFKLPVQQLEQMLHISSKTIQNKKQKNIALGPVHSEHLLKLMALYMKGVELFRTVDEFNYWLHKPFWFGDEKPVDWLVTPGGIDTVMDELVKMAYGDAI